MENKVNLYLEEWDFVYSLPYLKTTHSCKRILPVQENQIMSDVLENCTHLSFRGDPQMHRELSGQ
eukprot:1280754-Ditylum_brightwellii.AAC.1